MKLKKKKGGGDNWKEKKGEQLTWRTAWDKKDAGEGWREVKPFNPSPAVPPVPALDSLVFQWLVLLPWLWEKEPVYRKQAGCASHSLAGLGWRQKLALLAAEKAPASRGV